MFTQQFYFLINFSAFFSPAKNKVFMLVTVKKKIVLSNGTNILNLIQFIASNRL